MTQVFFANRHWTDADSRNFLLDPLGLMDLVPADFQGEEVTIFHACDDADLLAQVVTKMKSFGATKVNVRDQR